MTIQGTESLTRLADDLRESIPHVLGGYHLGQAAERIEMASEALKRLAPLDRDIDVEKGEN